MSKYADGMMEERPEVFTEFNILWMINMLNRLIIAVGQFRPGLNITL